MNYAITGNIPIVCKRLILIETRDDYQDLYVRNFKLDMSLNTYNKFGQVLATNPAGRNSTLSYSRVGLEIPEVIDLDPKPLYMANVANGWRTKRLRFILEVDSVQAGSTLTHYIQGYTDYYDPTLSMKNAGVVYNKLDPNMIFFMNSILTVSRSITSDGRYVVRPFAMYNIISNHGVDSYQELQFGGDNVAVRPLDVTKSILINDKFRKLDSDRIITDIGNLNTGTYTSKRSNGDPIKYFTDSINGYINSLNGSEVGYERADILSNTVDILQESNPGSNPFIFNLISITGNPNPTAFDLGTLEILDPTISSKATIVNRNAVGITGYNEIASFDTAYTTPLLNPTPESIRATIAANSLTSACVDNMLTKFSVSFTNSSGHYLVVPTGVQTMIEGIDDNYLTFLINKVKTHIETIIMLRITNNNAVLVTGCIQVDLFGDTTVTINVNNGGDATFRFPTFADSLYSPVIGNTQVKTGLVDDFSNVFEVATEVCGITY